MTSDLELLASYAEHRDEGAFAELVSRHLTLVYSAALRRTGGDTHLAQDIAQTVFTDLARKAARLKEHTSLTGWLYTSTRYAAMNASRAAQRREIREREAHQMHEATSSNEPVLDWERLGPVIDEAMHELDESDREAVLLRFFQGHPFLSVGARLGLSEDGARKRVQRALEELRAVLARRGITSSAAALIPLIVTSAADAVPAGLSATVTAAALSGSGAVGGVASFWSALTSSKTAVSLSAVLAAGGAVLVMSERREAERARHELTAARFEDEKLRVALAPSGLPAEIRALESQIASVRAKRAADDRAMEQAAEDGRTDDPASRSRMRLISRASLDTTYANLFRSLALSPEQLSQFIGLLTEKKVAERDAINLAKSRGLSVESSADIAFLNAAADADIVVQMRELIGDAKFSIYEVYEHTLPVRQPLMRLARQLRATAAPLSDEQMDRIVDVVAANVPDYRSTGGDTTRFFPDSVLDQLTAMLSAPQLAAFRVLLDAENARYEMFALNREAAIQGLLRLNAQSLKDYPPPPGSPADNAPPLDREDYEKPSGTSLVSAEFERANATEVLSLYRHLTGRALQVPVAVVEGKRRVSVSFKDLPPTAAGMMLKQALARAGLEIAPMDEKSDEVRIKEPAS